MTKEAKQRLTYIVTDIATTLIAFEAFNVVRFHFIERFLPLQFSVLGSFMIAPAVIAEAVLFPLMIAFLAWLTGFYNDVFYKSRLQVVGNTLLIVALATLFFFLGAMLNDVFPRRRLYYQLIMAVFGLTTFAVATGRLIISALDARAIRQGRRSVPVLMVGASNEAATLAERIEKAHRWMGMDIRGFADLGEGAPTVKGRNIVAPGGEEAFCRENAIRALVLAPSAKGGPEIMDLANRLLPLGLPMYVSPDLYNPSIRAGFNNVAGEPLIDIASPRIAPSTRNVKRLFDIAASALALAVLSPVFAALAVAVKLDSPGPVFYRQTRLGYRRRKFNILKFRSMRVDAEPGGVPRLSSADDPRVTRVGHFIRKYRLDELPNFLNVLRGDMSIVGPRPEREYFVRQLMERTPVYALIHSVRPGITSWGMVKYGYATNVDEMTERMRYDLLYVENLSLSVDLKIMFYTVKTIITGRGL